MQSRKNSIVRLGVGVSLLAVLSACGSSSSGAGGRGSGTGGTISGTGASAGSAQGGASNAGVGGSSGAPQSGGSSGAASGIGGSQSSGGMTFNLDGSAPPSCAAQKAPGSIRPLALDVLLDQSGSMGVKPHDYDTKWAPVTAALKSFFSDPSSANIYSALTFFPVSIPPEPNQSTAAVTAKCDFNSYVTPWVPMTALPSGIFATAIDMQTPNCYSTTTLPTVQGAIVYLQGVAQQMPNSKQAIVLVTDGDPTICPGNTIAAISAELQSVKDQIPTYVIGVGNVNGLNTLAASGGTGQAFIVAVADPTATQQAFSSALNSIRSSGVSCEVVIPPPPAGQTLDYQLVNVQYSLLDGSVVELVYDDTCVAANAWHYDNPAAPIYIELCSSSCSTANSSATTELDVEFGCAIRVY